jgi:hypothetical protein
MILVPYTSTITIDPSATGNKIALVHPGGSQVGSLYFQGFDLIDGRANGTHFRLNRHSSKATGGDTNTAYSFLDGAPASFAEVRSGNVTWPVDASTFPADAFADARGAGGGVAIPTRNAAAGALTIAPDHTLTLELVNADMRLSSYDVRLFWGEQRPALPHIASALLPASSAYTATTYFPVPIGWSKVTFFVTYTAHASASPGGVPIWRASATDGANDYPMLIADDNTLDISVLPTARRPVYRLEDEWPSDVPAGTTIRFAASYHIPPGAFGVRLDLAEIGDTTNRGTASVTVTGE